MLKSDESNFHVCGYENKQNFRYWATALTKCIKNHCKVLQLQFVCRHGDISWPPRLLALTTYNFIVELFEEWGIQWLTRMKHWRIQRKNVLQSYCNSCLYGTLCDRKHKILTYRMCKSKWLSSSGCSVQNLDFKAQSNAFEISYSITHLSEL